jgi:excisionase family DNA binding protein
MADDRSREFARFLTVGDAAEMLNVAPTEIVGLIESGELPAIRVGRPGAWRIERSELESYIEAMYEETRRRALWEQSELPAIPELSGGRIIWPDERR